MRWRPGSSRRSPRPLVGWGGGHPLSKNPTPLGASIFQRSLLGASFLAYTHLIFFANTPLMGSIVISLGWLPNDEGPGPQIFFLEPPLVRCGGRFDFTVFRSLSANPKVKELLKSVLICQSYRKNKSGTFLWPT